MAVAHSGSAFYNVTSGMVAAGTVEFPIRVSALFQGARGLCPTEHSLSSVGFGWAEPCEQGLPALMLLLVPSGSRVFQTYSQSAAEYRYRYFQLYSCSFFQVVFSEKPLALASPLDYSPYSCVGRRG